MSIIQVGLIDTTGKLDPEFVQSVAAAINIQMIRDLSQYWPVKATVRHLPDPKKLPAGVWPVRLVPEMPPGQGGVHMDDHHQPYAKVIARPEDDHWTIDASHEILEMVVDPYGNKLHHSRSIKITAHGTIEDATGGFDYLVEVADPCESAAHAYSIAGVAVSDFITPHFYDPHSTPGTRYSFTGSIKAPRQILPGGYVTYLNHETQAWEQILWPDPKQAPAYHKLGPAQAGQSLRVWVDSQVVQHRKNSAFKRTLNHSLLEECKQHRAALSRIATVRGTHYK